ncbi:transcription initiation factor TFIID subunit 8 [Impatiens glandulifera]|uniref:transcription initiation factor TFIID subunit 8 n=1 Tax=Impatiens glandulifera TaxID=253017 RepID=UPI001FB0BC7A|nr:transcription initiation factor TFIID subunit 8 [Impatiens glandulifera]XP_047313311.1 transcription initiation factor TFIID subunit 8 [Impatiens glandulifera]
MSDGAAEGGRDNSRNPTNKRSGADDFVQALAKIAVAQVFDSIGFQGFQQSALNVMSDVAVRYTREIGKISNQYANLADRNYCEVLDVIQALKELGSAEGFSGASDVNHCLANSGIIRELIQYVEDAGEIPFAYSIPPFPVSRDQKVEPSFIQLGQTPPDQHIPAWLPAFPDTQACIAHESPLVNERSVTDPKVEVVRKQKNPESSFLSLQQMLANNGSEFPKAVDGAKEKRVAQGNPFIAAPLPFGEKEEVCPVVPQPRMMEENTGNNHYSVFDDTFLQVTGAEKKTETHESEEQETGKEVVPESPKRPLIRFKLGVNKKKPIVALKNVYCESNGNMSSCSENDEKKKKSRIDTHESG